MVLRVVAATLPVALPLRWPCSGPAHPPPPSCCCCCPPPPHRTPLTPPGRELCDLVKEVQPAARRPQARLSFAFVYPDRRGRNVMRQVGGWGGGGGCCCCLGGCCCCCSWVPPGWFLVD